ncbi:hypothetical protein HK405_005995 [Cladochytrium tenue]|nr:hypothetical protein HK405_005995 [Cladochytrium tenue]
MRSKGQSTMYWTKGGCIEAVGAWRWRLRDGDSGGGGGDDDVCGICRGPFEGCCPTCTVPGEACPPVMGACTHFFHRHCIERWVATEQSRGLCPMDRTEWSVGATFPPAEATE